MTKSTGFTRMESYGRVIGYIEKESYTPEVHAVRANTYWNKYYDTVMRDNFSFELYKNPEINTRIEEEHRVSQYELAVNGIERLEDIPARTDEENAVLTKLQSLVAEYVI